MPPAPGALAASGRDRRNDRVLRNKLVARAQRDVTQLSWDVQLPKLIEIYEATLKVKQTLNQGE